MPHERPQAVSTSHRARLRLSCLLQKWCISLHRKMYYDTKRVIIILICMAKCWIFEEWKSFVEPGVTCVSSTNICGRAIFKRTALGPVCTLSLANFGDILFPKSKLSLAEGSLIRKPDSSYISCLSCIIFLQQILKSHHFTNCINSENITFCCTNGAFTRGVDKWWLLLPVMWFQQSHEH